MLTAQKRKFALALMSGMSKKDAAIEAGYSEKSARSKGSQLAKAPEVIAFTERKKNEVIEVDDVPAYRKNVNTPADNVYTPTVNTDEKRGGAGRYYEDPIEYLKAVMNGVEPDNMGRRDAAKAMLPYTHPKKGEGGKKDAKQAAAKAVASKFAGMAPPQLVVNNGKQ
ncbi:terminase small subunit [Rahnella sp. ChDrAdgB13]|uniref:terminase small subunit n=1 Tax=Rahnella sp. ChDrAdgB13 TaxID=1850581 RepID=UPI001AD8924A|nr:terminase small subunit [Rahnella sp. ChDrAdgB13]